MSATIIIKHQKDQTIRATIRDNAILAIEALVEMNAISELAEIGNASSMGILECTQEGTE